MCREKRLMAVVSKECVELLMRTDRLQPTISSFLYQVHRRLDVMLDSMVA